MCEHFESEKKNWARYCSDSIQLITFLVSSIKFEKDGIILDFLETLSTELIFWFPAFLIVCVCVCSCVPVAAKRTQNGNTALDLANERGHTAVVALLED